LFPIPAGLDPNNHAHLPAIMAAMTMAAKLMIVGGWCLGAFVGAGVAARLANHRLIAALIVGALVVAGTLANASEIPHPQWMTTVGTLLPLPLAWLAVRLLPGPPLPEPEVKRWVGNEHER
jgi:hypothetical protein